MAVAPLTENKNSNVDDSGIMNIEFVQFTSVTTGDYYDCKKLREVESAFASQETEDGEEIQCSWNSDSPPRVTLTFETKNAVTGYLVVIGRM